MNKEITLQEFDMIKKIPMVFIMGKERSGTTLLQTLLDGHPNIIAPPESVFIVMLYPRFGRIKKWTEKDVYNFINELFKETWIAKIWQIDRGLLTLSLLSIKDEADYSTVCKIVYYYMRNNKENILLISDKNPIYALFINSLLKIFPDAKFIHLIREPKDTVCSHLKSFHVNNERFISLKWLAYNNILREAQLAMPGKFHTLLYENMVEDTELSMEKLCDFLNIKFNEKMLHNSFSKRLQSFDNQQLIVDRALLIHANLLKPVNKSNIGKWKNEMSSEKIQIVEKITGKFAAQYFHYPIEMASGTISLASKIKIAYSRILYYCWQTFTRIKFKNYWFNKTYTRFKIIIGVEKEEFGKIE